MHLVEVVVELAWLKYEAGDHLCLLWDKKPSSYRSREFWVPLLFVGICPSVIKDGAAGVNYRWEMSSAWAPEFVRRTPHVLRPDPRRVVARLFLPGQEVLANGVSRADAVMLRVLAMTDDEVASGLGELRDRFAGRHADLEGTFAANFALVAHRLPVGTDPSPQRCDLIGGYFTSEYSVEAAALFNPSMVAHPDQNGLAANEVRFIMSVRAVGEGHISSVEFRTGVVGPGDAIRIDDPSRTLAAGRAIPAPMTRDYLRDALAELAPSPTADYVLRLLPDQFVVADLEAVLTSIRLQSLTRSSGYAIIDRIRWIAACNYRLCFGVDTRIGERVIFPAGPDESHGVEDARFTRFVDDDGIVSYYGTYTAFDGENIAPHLLHTIDFATFESRQLVGPAARNKGMALFPRRIDGEYVALTRWDRENIGVARSADAHSWRTAVTVQTPCRPWELIQLGNCGPPIETAAGWLVLTHGVGRCANMPSARFCSISPTRPG